MSWYNSLRVSPSAILKKDGNKIIIMLTSIALSRYKYNRFLHLHMEIPYGYDHLGDWELIKIVGKYDRITYEGKLNGRYTYFKCILKKQKESPKSF